MSLLRLFRPSFHLVFRPSTSFNSYPGSEKYVFLVRCVKAGEEGVLSSMELCLRVQGRMSCRFGSVLFLTNPTR